MEDFRIGDTIWIINSFGISHVFYKCKILELTEWEITVEILNKSNKKRVFYVHQQNIKFLKDKKIARLMFIAKVCKKKDLINDFDRLYEDIKANTGLTSKTDIRNEIVLSQSQFPELWI